MSSVAILFIFWNQVHPDSVLFCGKPCPGARWCGRSRGGRGVRYFQPQRGIMLVENHSHPFYPTPAGRNVKAVFNIPPRWGWGYWGTGIATNIMPLWGCSTLSGKINNGKKFCPPFKAAIPPHCRILSPFSRSPTLL